MFPMTTTSISILTHLFAVRNQNIAGTIGAAGARFCFNEIILLHILSLVKKVSVPKCGQPAMAS